MGNIIGWGAPGPAQLKLLGIHHHHHHHRRRRCHQPRPVFANLLRQNALPFCPIRASSFLSCISSSSSSSSPPISLHDLITYALCIRTSSPPLLVPSRPRPLSPSPPLPPPPLSPSPPLLLPPFPSPPLPLPLSLSLSLSPSPSRPLPPFLSPPLRPPLRPPSPPRP